MAALVTFVLVAMAVAAHPVQAQLPPLPPITLLPSDPGTTTTTLLPPLTLPAELLPTPGTTSPVAALLPVPTTAPARKTTTYKPPAVPPSTPARPLVTSAPPKRGRATTAPTGQPEPGSQDPGYTAQLPFADQQSSAQPSSAVELGIESSARDQVGSAASVAAGLIAMVLFGGALLIRSEARRAPDPW